MLRNIIIIIALIAVLGVPFALRKPGEVLANPDETLIIISPHNETIRYEFETGFREWYLEKTGKTVEIDWRVIGGTSEIVRSINSEYINAFRLYWEQEMGRKWSKAVQGAFDNRKLRLDAPDTTDEMREAREAFLASDVGIGIDIFFGGGDYEFYQKAGQGQLVDSGLLEKHPDRFGEGGIPQTHNGETFWDKDGRWVGACLSSFGIVFNRVSLDRLEIEDEPAQWVDLTDPRLLGEIAAADPSKSGSINKAFEMIIQQQMAQRMMQRDMRPEAEKLADGWMRGLQIIQKIAANARYFTDSATKPSLDVSLGDCAAGMSIDFYGRFQQEVTNSRAEATGNAGRFGYLTPVGGSTVSCDPIGILRGAPNAELAEEFVEFVLSLEGQKIWNMPVGTEGGPKEFALRRPPMRPELYQPPLNAQRSDPDFNPYDGSNPFVYHREWTGHLFGTQRFLIKTCFIDVHDEVKEAWGAVIEADFPPKATALFDDLAGQGLDYARVQTEISEIVNGSDPIAVVQLAKKMSNDARKRYAEVVRLAKAGE